MCRVIQASESTSVANGETLVGELPGIVTSTAKPPSLELIIRYVASACGCALTILIIMRRPRRGRSRLSRHALLRTPRRRAGGRGVPGDRRGPGAGRYR